jgi:hypothetical protein
MLAFRAAGAKPFPWKVNNLLYDRMLGTTVTLTLLIREFVMQPLEPLNG